MEQGLMNDDRLLITDGVHTENTEGNGGPQADDGGERKLKRIIRDLKKKIYIHRCHRWSQIDVRKRTGDLGE